ncbi:MAG: PilZ domain-containing protein [Polyangiaceae bacterium]
MTRIDSANSSHFRAGSRHAVSLAGALHGAGANTDPGVPWSRDVRVVDLGLGGACIEASDSVAQGTDVELVLDTPHLWDPLTLGGVVAWTRKLPDPEGGGALIGVRFEHSTGGTIRTLTELLEAEAFG